LHRFAVGLPREASSRGARTRQRSSGLATLAVAPSAAKTQACVPGRSKGSSSKKDINGSYFAVPSDDDIGAGVGRQLAGAARDPTDPPPQSPISSGGEIG